jgi:hypothetical protein
VRNIDDSGTLSPYLCDVGAPSHRKTFLRLLSETPLKILAKSGNLCSDVFLKRYPTATKPTLWCFGTKSGRFRRPLFSPHFYIFFFFLLLDASGITVLTAIVHNPKK